MPCVIVGWEAINLDERFDTQRQKVFRIPKTRVFTNSPSVPWARSSLRWADALCRTPPPTTSPVAIPTIETSETLIWKGVTIVGGGGVHAGPRGQGFWVQLHIPRRFPGSPKSGFQGWGVSGMSRIVQPLSCYRRKRANSFTRTVQKTNNVHIYWHTLACGLHFL